MRILTFTDKQTLTLECKLNQYNEICLNQEMKKVVVKHH